MTQPVIDTSLVDSSDRRSEGRYYRRTRAKIERLIEQHPQKEKDYYFELAQLEAIQKDWERAQQAVESVLRIAPNHAEALLFMAQVLEYQQEYEKAKSTYQYVIENHPELSVAYREYGRFLLGQKQASLVAIQSILLKGLELDPKDAFAHTLLAQLYLSQKLSHQALLHVEIARSVNKGDLLVYQEVARLYMLLEKQEEATKLWQYAIQRDPKNKKIKHQMKQMMKAMQKKKGKNR